MSQFLFYLAAGLSVLVTGALALMTMRDPVGGLKKLDHLPERLPHVMAGRYLSFFVLALGAAIYGDPLVLLWLFVGFTVASAVDTMVYYNNDEPYGPHLQAGIATAVGVIICLYVLVSE